MRRNSTGKEELQAFASMIIQEDQMNLLNEEEKKKFHSTIEKSFVGTKIEDPLRNKPLFHLVDKFSLFDSDYFDI